MSLCGIRAARSTTSMAVTSIFIVEICQSKKNEELRIYILISSPKGPLTVVREQETKCNAVGTKQRNSYGSKCFGEL